ncbi:40S ribosomal protein S19, partial [Haematococcus lacustris]
MHRGAAPEKFSKSSGGLVRHIMQSLEEIGILEKCTSIKGGRKLTASGQRDMDVIAGGIKAELEQL